MGVVFLDDLGGESVFFGYHRDGQVIGCVFFYYDVGCCEIIIFFVSLEIE